MRKSSCTDNILELSGRVSELQNKPGNKSSYKLAPARYTKTLRRTRGEVYILVFETNYFTG